MTERFDLLKFLAGHPTAANLLMLIIFFAGFYTLGGIRRETLPDFAASKVEITVKYRGATAEEVENAVCRRVERALEPVSNVVEVISEARENQGRVVVEMREGGDIRGFLGDIKTEVEAIDDFPAEVEKPVVKELNRTDLVVSVAVTGPMSAAHLRTYCRELRDKLVRLPEISQVDLLGFSERQVRIEVPAAILMQYGLSLQDIADRVARQSLDLPAGTIETGEADVLVRFTGERRLAREFQDLVVHSAQTGAEIRLGDIARISDTFELDETKASFNGARAGLLQVSKTKTEDALIIMEAVRRFLDRERRLAPPTVSFHLTQNVSDIIRDRLDLLVVNGLQGLALVFLVMWLFFSLRLSFWVAMGLPVSFLGALFVMHLIGFSLNMLTMMGLILGLGLLMDDAIVISENVAKHLKAGRPPLTAAVLGTREVAAGVFSSYLTTVAIFGFLAVMMRGEVGKVLWVMPVVLILVLSFSILEAFLILPNHLAHWLNQEKERSNRLRRALDGLIDWLTNQALKRLVTLAVGWRYAFLGLTVSAFLVSLGLLAGGMLKFRAFPDLDGDVLQARILLPQGSPLKTTEAVVEKVVRALKQVDAEFRPLQPDQKPLVESVGVTYNLNADAGEYGPHVATVSADLLAAQKRNAALDDVTNRWRELVGEIPEVINITYKEPQIGPGGLAIDVRLQGQDLGRLKLASLDLMNWLNRYQGALDLNDDLRPGKPEIRVSLNPGAVAFGLTAAGLAQQLRTAFYGRTVSEVQVGPDGYRVDLRLAQEDQDSLADLEYVHVVTPSGQQIPLNSVARLEPGRGFARINRINSLRTVSIQGEVDSKRANAAEIIADTRTKFMPGFKERFPEVEVMLEGQAKEMAKGGQSLVQAMVVGLFAIYVLLSFQFRSYIEPLVVMAAIPLALIGVLWGHYLMGLDFSLPSLMGFVSLAGVVVNNSILLVEFTKEGIRRGLSAAAAAAQASQLRLRAILLTSLTTIFGLLPLLTEKSLQAQMLIPVAASIVFGLLASTVMVLLVLPALYTIFDDLGLTELRRARETGQPS